MLMAASFLCFSSLQKLQLSRDQLQSDYDKLKTDEVDREKKLRELSVMADRREQAKQDLKGIMNEVVLNDGCIC